MKNTTDVIQQFLGTLHIHVPKVVIRQQLDTPLGNTIRGISDALDSLGIRNAVYQLPKEYLQELDTPFLVSMPHQPQPYQVVTHSDKQFVSLLGEQDMLLERFLKRWDGVALTAERTEHTATFRCIWLYDVTDWINRHHLLFLPLLMAAFSFLFMSYDVVRLLHLLLILTGVYTSTVLLYREYRDSTFLWKYCRIGKWVNCKEIEQSGGNRIFGLFRMCDLSFLFFVTMLLYAVLTTDGYWTWSMVLLAVGCLFTLYSVILQFLVVKKVCLFCMVVNVMVWADTLLLGLQHHVPSLQVNFPFVFSVLLSYMLWYCTRRILKDARNRQGFQVKLSHIYRKDMFDFLLSRSPSRDDLPDCYAERSGADTGYVISIVVHPECEACSRIRQYLPALAAKAKVKVFSLDKPEVMLCCLRQGITQTPTVIINGHLLPDLYSLKDLLYIL